MTTSSYTFLFSCERHGFNVIGRYDICHVLFTSLVDLRACLSCDVHSLIHFIRDSVAEALSTEVCKYRYYLSV